MKVLFAMTAHSELNVRLMLQQEKSTKSAFPIKAGDVTDHLVTCDKPFNDFSFASPSQITSVRESTEEKGQLNGDLVKLFVDTQVYLVIKNKQYKNTCSECGNFHHHVCDFD
ncbi:TPA: hypothetical protein ACGUM3_001239 [Vibrio vulnificus]